MVDTGAWEAAPDDGTFWRLLSLSSFPFAFVVVALFVFVRFLDVDSSTAHRRLTDGEKEKDDGKGRGGGGSAAGELITGWHFPAKENRDQRRLRWARAIHQRLKRTRGLSDSAVHGKALFSADQLVRAMAEKARGSAGGCDADAIRLRLLLSLLESGPPQKLQPIVETSDSSSSSSSSAADNGNQADSQLLSDDTASRELSSSSSSSSQDASPDSWLAIDLAGDTLGGFQFLPRPYELPRQRQARARVVGFPPLGRSASCPTTPRGATGMLARVLEEGDPVIALRDGYATRQVVWDAIALLSRNPPVAVAS